MQGNFVKMCAAGALVCLGAGTAWAGGYAAPVCNPAPLTRPVCPPVVCETKPTYPKYQVPCAVPVRLPRGPVCDFDLSKLRCTITEIAKLFISFQEKVRCSRKFDPRIFTSALQIVTQLVRLQVLNSSCNADYERAICNIEKSCNSLEELVKCSGNSEWTQLVRKIQCLVKELASCRKQTCNGSGGGAGGA